MTSALNLRIKQDARTSQRGPSSTRVACVAAITNLGASVVSQEASLSFLLTDQTWRLGLAPKAQYQTVKECKQNMQCVTPPEDLENSSPILDLSIVKNTELDKYPGWKSTPWNDDMTLVWTKDYGKLPLTSFKLEASEPCLDPYDQPKVSSSQFWYKTEMV
eukprot:CAMPEP_0170452144 /NCGR_PEP_ID=MMETSP0123-20130129/1145_1 /TAXON_ID=182087 /ORGANISM="Favella ehrenbergii, Strain Fehren 1" /LENGTH=160 /DNA_ID=CAMNT_0010714061 /DNA_START=234 /DNA_END=715 /DNA_ORIENTATION=+